jgi:cytochrome c biogenesis protein CcdA
MRKIVLFLLLLIPILSAYSEDKITATLFYSTHCKACLDLKEEFLPAIREKYADKVEWKNLNVDENPESLSLLFSLAQHFRDGDARYPSLFVGNHFLVGSDEIKKELEEVIEVSLKKRVTPLDFRARDLSQVFEKISAFTVMGSGLIDGINPCAFAVIVFFVSFLSVYGYKRKEIVCVGAFYCLAVFIAYLLIGLGFFKFLYAFMGFYYVIRIFYYFVGGICFFFAGLSLYDYMKFKKTGTGEGLILQLPLFLKKKINLVIGTGLREKKERGLIDLSISAFTIGFLVSLLEAVCTGQVYLPTIVFILKTTNLRLRAFAYLILYNIMFILPLLIIFLLSFLGISSQRFNSFLKSKLGKIKIIMAILFFVLGVFIIWLS